MAQTINYDHLDEVLLKIGPSISIDYDPRILGAIFGQTLILVSDIPDVSPGITPKQWDELEKLLNHLAYKLGAVQYHLDRYRHLQDLRRKEILGHPRMVELMKRGMIENDRQIGYEFESWCHQVKSSLEMLVQIFFPVLGSTRKEFPEPKYKNKGERVAVHLEQKKKNKKVMAAYSLDPWKIDGLIKFIRAAKDAWISSIVDWRDATTHRFPYLQVAFRWDNGADQLLDPIASDRCRLSDIMQNVTNYLLDYSRDFITMSISCKKPQNVLPRLLTDLERRYFSILWRSQGYEMDAASAKWRFNQTSPIGEDDIETLLREIEAQTKSKADKPQSGL